MKEKELTMKKSIRNVKEVVAVGVLAGLSIMLVYLIHFPIIPMLPFLEYDPADIPILIGGFAFGPLAGVILTGITSVIQGLTVSSASGVYGIIMHILATSTLVGVSSLIYFTNKTKKRAAIGLVAGAIAMTIVMVGANYVVTPYFMGIPTSAITPMVPYIAAFNVIKATINGVVTFIIYKRISNFIHSK